MSRSKKTGYHVTRWLGEVRVEGPITPLDADDLVHAFLWDGDYVRAHDLAGGLTKFYTKTGGDFHKDIEFGRFLGIRTTLAAVIAKKTRRTA